MDFREQLFMAVDNNDVNKVDEMLASITPKDPDFIDVLFAMQRACEQQNLQVVDQLLPYATEFFFEGKGPRDPSGISTLALTPYDTFFELLQDWVLPSNNIELFKIFVPIMLHNINSEECADILIDCYERDQVELIDCVLPFLNDLSGFQKSYAPHIGEFFEQRKAQYQHDTIMREMNGNPPSYAQRKM